MRIVVERSRSLQTPTSVQQQTLLLLLFGSRQGFRHPQPQIWWTLIYMENSDSCRPQAIYLRTSMALPSSPRQQQLDTALPSAIKRYDLTRTELTLTAHKMAVTTTLPWDMRLLKRTPMVF